MWSIAAHAAPATGGRPLSGMMMAAGVFLMTLCVFSILRKRMRTRGVHRPTIGRAAADRNRMRAASQAKSSVEAVVVEAEELVRRMAAHLDNKAARLELLIREADERLTKLQNEGVDLNEGPSRPAAAPRNDVYYESKLSDPISRDVYRLADEGLAPVQIAQQLSEGVGKVELILALRNN